MSRPYQEVIILDNIVDNLGRVEVTNNTNINLKRNAVTILWAGSIDKFISDFELPRDAVISSMETGLGNGTEASFITKWDYTTINFKFNYQIWYKSSDSGNTENNYVLGSNNTINVTCPNIITFNGREQGDSEPIYFRGPNDRVYNPNIFRVPCGITSFITSNKSDNFQSIAGGGNYTDIYLVFRFGVHGNDIEICLLTQDNAAFQVNNSPLIMPYASLTFTGFNKIKRLN